MAIAHLPEEAGFDLRLLIREELETNPSADPYVVAAEVAKRVPDHRLREVVDYCLVRVVKEVAGVARHTAMHPPASGLRPVGGRSERWGAVKVLRSRLCVDPDEREWKFLADATRDDVLRAADVRRQQAAANAAWAERYERLAEKMRVYRAATVSDLPPDAIEEAMR